MPDLIRFSDLKDSHPLTLDGNNDLFAIAVKNDSSETGYTSMTVKPNIIAGYTAEDATYTNLKTGSSDNTIVKAINKTLGNFANEFNTTSGSTYAEGDCVIYSGLLYQCINASGTTSGTFVVADWTQIKAVDVGTGGGGGSSTLVGLADVNISSPAEGQVLKYDSTSSKWINGTGGGSASYTELTQDEYDQLTPAQKTNGTMYFITDANGDGSQFQPVIYSATEREIGVWTDGKPLYEKTIDLGTLPSTAPKAVAHNVSNLGIVIYASGTAYNSTSQVSLPIPYVSGGSSTYNIDINVDSTNVTVTTYTNRSAFVGYIKLQYTKSTDTAGSGTWTPRGVPAVHYSTNEQIVGTWIDGSTIYQKTYVFETELVLTPNTWTYTDISNAGITKIISFEAMNNSGTNLGFLGVNRDSYEAGTIGILNIRNVNTPCKILTVRYTKSSS